MFSSFWEKEKEKEKKRTLGGLQNYCKGWRTRSEATQLKLKLKSRSGAGPLRLHCCSLHIAACSAAPWPWGLGAALWHHCAWKLDLDMAAYSARSDIFCDLYFFVSLAPNLTVVAHVSACPNLSHVPVPKCAGRGKESIRNVLRLCWGSHKASERGKLLKQRKFRCCRATGVTIVQYDPSAFMSYPCLLTAYFHALYHLYSSS